jgi:hypothetical protein
MSDIFENKKVSLVNLTEWSIDELYNEWTSTHADLTRCIRDREFASENHEDITKYRNKIEYELERKGYKWQ